MHKLPPFIGNIYNLYDGIFLEIWLLFCSISHLVSETKSKQPHERLARCRFYTSLFGCVTWLFNQSVAGSLKFHPFNRNHLQVKKINRCADCWRGVCCSPMKQHRFSISALLMINASMHKKYLKVFVRDFSFSNNCTTLFSHNWSFNRSYCRLDSVFANLTPHQFLILKQEIRSQIFSKILTAARAHLWACTWHPALTRGRSAEADTACDAAQVCYTASAVTVICCLPGASVNKLKRREKKRYVREREERMRLTVELAARAKPSQVNWLLQIRHDSVMNEHTHPGGIRDARRCLQRRNIWIASPRWESVNVRFERAKTEANKAVKSCTDASSRTVNTCMRMKKLRSGSLLQQWNNDKKKTKKKSYYNVGQKQVETSSERCKVSQYHVWWAGLESH